MKDETRRPFYWRSFVTLSILLAFITIALAGIVLYFAPPGRIANWTIWQFLSLTKSQWQAVHTVFAFLFVLAIGFHIYFNWSVLVTYLTRKIQETLKMKREIALAGAVYLLVLSVSVANVPPSSLIMDMGEALKRSWADPRHGPPVPHAESLSLAKLAHAMDTPLDSLQRRLRRGGLGSGGRNVTLGQIAAEHNLTPLEVYKQIAGKKSSTDEGLREGGGYGRMSMREAARTFGVDGDSAGERLAEYGIEADWDATVREVAAKHNISPHKVIEIIRGGD
jgi:hypothetical protein